MFFNDEYMGIMVKDPKLKQKAPLFRAGREFLFAEER